MLVVPTWALTQNRMPLVLIIECNVDNTRGAESQAQRVAKAGLMLSPPSFCQPHCELRYQTVGS